MRGEDRLYFQECEEQKNHELDSLFDDWIKQLEKNETPIHNGNYKKTTPSDCFAKDVFFLDILIKKRKFVLLGEKQDLLVAKISEKLRWKIILIDSKIRIIGGDIFYILCME